MRLIISGLSFALLGFCFLGLPGCGEDNETASKELAAKSATTVDPAKAIPQAKSMEDYFKSNPGSSGQATSSGTSASKKR